METKVKFRCLLSNNIFEFSTPFDIEEMRKHPQYAEVFEEEEMPKKTVVKKKQKEVSK